MAGFLKENKWKLGELGKKYGRKSNRVRIVEVGVKLVESIQYPTIKAALGIWSVFHLVSNEYHNMEYKRA